MQTTGDNGILDSLPLPHMSQPAGLGIFKFGLDLARMQLWAHSADKLMIGDTAQAQSVSMTVFVAYR